MNLPRVIRKFHAPTVGRLKDEKQSTSRRETGCNGLLNWREGGGGGGGAEDVGEKMGALPGSRSNVCMHSRLRRFSLAKAPENRGYFTV